MTGPLLSMGVCAQLACMWEVTARKAGNVHRYQDFADTSYLDFLQSAAAVAPILDTAWRRPLGETVLAAVYATRQVVRTNTNLGIVLLLAPLATAAGQPLRAGLADVLERTTVDDARQVYEAIRLANPSGLGRVPDQDVSQGPTLTLREVMGLAAERDLVARQYTNGYADVFEGMIPSLQASLHEGLEAAIIQTQLRFLASHPDSLIVRKRGFTEALRVRDRALAVLRGEEEWAAFDAWLREDGHARNPGTTADLLTAAVFVGLRESWLTPLTPFAAPTH